MKQTSLEREKNATASKESKCNSYSLRKLSVIMIIYLKEFWFSIKTDTPSAMSVLTLIAMELPYTG